MKKVLMTICLVILVLPILISCSAAAGGGSSQPSQQDVQATFAALGTATQSATSGNMTNPIVGPPTWRYIYTLYVGSGSLTLVLDSNVDLLIPAYAGMSGSMSGNMTFANFPTSAGIFNGTLNVGVSFNTSTAYNGDLIMNETVSYQGSATVRGGSVSSFSCNFTGYIGMDLTAGTVVSLSRTGTITVDGYSYGVRGVNARAESFDVLKIVR
jgi:hypothetical protein